jgi:quinol monooxygenase YgiN
MEKTMITLAVKCQCHPGKSDEVLAALRRMSALVKQHEPDCHAYQFSRSIDDPDALLFYELYADQAALDFHRQTAYFKEIVEGEVFPMLASRERSLYTLEIE